LPFQCKRFYESSDDFQRFHHTLKQVRCPHCRRVGFLNLHGLICGYEEDSPTRVRVRGHRIFCSNRGHLTGCGRTFSVMDAANLKGFTISAASLWRFLEGMAASLPKITAFRSAVTHLGETSAYRLCRRFVQAQSRIRSLLARHGARPQATDASQTAGDSPFAQTIAHLKAAFGQAPCPIAAFQSQLQASFL
jgi:hypothetical protein